MINELDNFKNAWKNLSEAELKKDFSASDLKKLVKKSSNSELAKIRRKLLLEWSIAIALSIFLVLFVRFINPNDTKYALLFIGVILAICFFPYINVIRLKLTSHTDLINYLSEFILRFDKLVKQYIRMATILIPVAGLGGFLLGFHSSASIEEWNNFFNAKNMLFVGFFVVLVSFAGYWVQGRYFKWIYGKNIQRLRDCLADLEQVEENDLL